jgi:hypothetical protein
MRNVTTKATNGINAKCPLNQSSAIGVEIGFYFFFQAEFKAEDLP